VFKFDKFKLFSGGNMDDYDYESPQYNEGYSDLHTLVQDFIGSADSYRSRHMPEVSDSLWMFDENRNDRDGYENNFHHDVQKQIDFPMEEISNKEQ
jgi:hypothetical protein